MQITGIYSVFFFTINHGYQKGSFSCFFYSSNISQQAVLAAYKSKLNYPKLPSE